MEIETTSHRTLKDYLLIAGRGFCMGASDVVPGVSGGTMAFILGIYNELIAAINSIDLTFIRRIVKLQWGQAFQGIPWRFLLSVALGILVAVLTVTNALHVALEAYPTLVWSFFFGLIVASILIVRKRVSNWNAINLFAAIVASVGGFYLVGLTPSETPNTPLLLFLSGALAICAMILPGISGAFILVLLGKYRNIVNAVVEFDILTLLIVGLGAVVGLLSFARLLRWLLRKNHDLVVAILTGFMAGSLRKIWPWKTYDLIGEAAVREFNYFPTALTGDVMLAIVFMVTGITLVLLIERSVNQRKSDS
jgi:putative membrane protein